MMTPTAILEELKARKVTIEVAGDKLRFRPGDAVPADLREAIIANKAALLQLLTPQEAAPECPKAPSPTGMEVGDAVDFLLRRGLLPQADPVLLAALHLRWRVSLSGRAWPPSP